MDSAGALCVEDQAQRAMMTKYNHILFDLDDTLLDFRASEKASFEKTMDHFQIKNPADDLYSEYKKISLNLWTQLENGEMSKDRLKVQRYEELFNAFEIGSDASEASEFYLDQLPLNIFFVEGALEVCEALYLKKDMTIVTNGIASVQFERMERSGLNKFFKKTVVSEQCGYAKPHPKIFEEALGNSISSLEKSSCIMVGDRLESDILGAKNYGIDSCWFNPKRHSEDIHIRPNIQIQSLKQLLN